MKSKRLWQPIVIGCFIVWWICSNQFRINYVMERRNILEPLILIAFFSKMLYVVIVQKKRDFDTIVRYILIGAFIVRAFYVIVTPYNISTHDLGNFVNIDNEKYSSGHLGYIEYLYHYHCLPNFDPRKLWSFYNPPGFHILGAFVLWISHDIFGIVQPLCFESLQVISLFFSSMTVWVFYCILREFDFKKSHVLLATAFVSFYPFFMIYSATLNNDIQGVFFMFLAVWYAIRWYKNQSLKNIVVIALALGIGMFTKINAALICFGIGFIFITVYWKNRKERKKYFTQFASFLAICMPIGLFMPILNYVKYQIPFTYVQEISKDNWLYLGTPGIINRLGVIFDQQLTYAFTTLDAKVEHNIWIQTVRTALFDELRVGTSHSWIAGWALILLWGNLILAIVLNIAFIYMIIKKNTMEWKLKGGLAIMYATLMISYIKYCFDQPFVCTMNFRYIAITLLFPILGGLYMANFCETMPVKDQPKYITANNILMIFIGILTMISIVFEVNLIMLS